MNRLLNKCPVCDEDLVVTHLFCSHCHTTLEGKFNLPSSPLSKLSPEQMQFLLTFIRCEGKFNRMEEELKLSYPTLRSRFNEVLQSMGFEAEEEVEVSLSPEERKKILVDLNKGRISAEEAQIRLKGAAKIVEK
jgi:hypothetical protein